MSKAVQKGKSGENEFCQLINHHFDVNLERQYNQASGDSTDVIFDPYFLFEVKRREKLDFDPWWSQVRHAEKAYKLKYKKYIMPVVAFRQNRKEWEFLIPASLIGIDTRYLHVDRYVFLTFARNYINQFADAEEHF